MIISASRRTDIPGFYSEWFFNRIKDKYVYVRNPINIHQISKIDLSPDIVDCIVFWTKNPQPMLDKLELIKEYSFYFQFTLNSYGKDVEVNVPLKSDFLIETFKRLSEKIGSEKVIWRYDPIFINDKYTMEYHVEYFGKLARILRNYTEKCTISFIDFYPKIKNNISSLVIQEMTNEEKRKLAAQLVKTAFEFGLKMDTCAESIELEDLGIAHARCIDDKLISKIIGHSILAEKDKNQRLECGCVASIDIGLYNTCLNGCKYCYANHSTSSLNRNSSCYDANSPILCSNIGPEDVINERKVKSLKENQLNMFNQY